MRSIIAKRPIHALNSARSTHRRVLHSIASAAALALAVSSAYAQTTLYFDANGATSGLGATGTYTWGASTLDWATSAAPGTTAPGTWIPGSVASFNASFGTILLADSESLSGLTFATGVGATNIGVTGAGPWSLNFGSSAFTITQGTTAKQILAVPIVGSGDMTIKNTNAGTAQPIDLAGTLTGFTGNIYVVNSFTGAVTATNGAQLQLESNFGGTGTIYLDQYADLYNDNQVGGNFVPGGTGATFMNTPQPGTPGDPWTGLQATPDYYTISHNIVLNYNGVAENTTSAETNSIGTANGPTINTTFNGVITATSYSKIAAYSGVISSPAGVKSNLNIGNGSSNGVVVLANQNTYTGSTTITVSATNGMVQLAADNALPATTALILGTAATAVGPLDLDGHNETIASLSTGTSNTSLNGVGNIYNLSVNNPTYNFSQNPTGNAATLTITPATATNTTFKGDIGSANIAIQPLNNNVPYKGATTPNTNINLVLNGPTDGTSSHVLTLAPVAALPSGNEYTGTTTINSRATLVLGRTNPFNGTPGNGYTITGGGNVIVNSGGTLSSVATNTTTYAGGAAGNIILNSGSFLTPGGAGAAGVLSTGAITFNTGSSINFDLTSASSFDQIFANGGLSLDSSAANHNINLALTSGATLVPGTYNLITGSISGDAPNAASFTLNTSSISTTDQFKLVDTGSALQLQILAPALRWDPVGNGANATVTEGGGTWTDGSTFVNLLNSPQSEAFWSNTAYPTSDVIIGSDATQPGDVISLGENITVGGKLTFGPIFPGYNYSINGNGHSLTLAGGVVVSNTAATYDATSGALQTPSAEIDSPVILSANQTWSIDPTQYLKVTGTLTGNFALTKSGSGTLELDGAGGSIGSLTVLAGIAQFGAADAIGSAPITLNGGGVIFYNLSGTLPNSLTIGVNGGQVGTTTGNTLTLSNNISTANAFGVVGTGTVALTGTNSFGTLDLFGGALQVSSAANFGNPASISTGTNAAISAVLSSSVPLTINGVISGAGNLVLNGPDFTLAGANTIGQPGGPGTAGGAISLNTANQIIHVTNASGLGTGTTVIGATPVTVEIDAPTVNSGSIRNNLAGGILHKTGTGTWILNGSSQSNSATGGAIDIDNGAIEINTVAALGGTNVTTQPGPDLVLNSGGSLLLNLGGTRYSGNITLNGGTIARLNNSSATGDFQFSTYSTDDATNLFNTTITVTANSVVDNQENTGSAAASKDLMLEMPIVINSGATLTAQSEDTAANHQKGTVIFRGVANDTTYPYMNVFLQPGATLMTAGVGEIDLGGTGRGDPIIANGTPGNDSKLLLTSIHSFLRDAGSAVENAGVTDMTRLVINGTGSAGLRVEAPMNAVYVNLGDGTNDACTTGLFGINTVSAPNANAFTVFSPARASALSNPYTLASGTVINPQGTLTLAATDSAGATGVVNTGPTASIPMSLALDNTATSGNLIYQLDGSAATTGVKLLNFASGITLERSNSSAGTVLGQLKSNTHIASLTILNSATFDLVDHALELESSTNVSSYLSSAAIFSSSVNADANHITTIAQVTGAQLGLTGAATTTLQGITFDANSLLLKAAYFGDINLDGRINADDYALMDRSVAKGFPADWIDGDFNNDGLVNSADYMLMDRAFALSNGGTLSPSLLAQRESQFGDAYVQSLLTSIPEPTTLSLLALATPLLTRRRRTR